MPNEPSAANTDSVVNTQIRKHLEDVCDGWEVHLRRSTFRKNVTFASRGLELGAGTLLGEQVSGSEKRVLALLRVAFSSDIYAGVVDSLKAAEAAHLGGDLAKSTMLVALSKVPSQIDLSGARRLHIVSSLLDSGFLDVSDVAVLADGFTPFGPPIEKYDPDQPRIPKAKRAAANGQLATLLRRRLPMGDRLLTKSQCRRTALKSGKRQWRNALGCLRCQIRLAA